MSGTTITPLAFKITSASGVNGPFAASPIIFALIRSALSALITFSKAAGIKISHSISNTSALFVTLVAPGKFKIEHSAAFEKLCRLREVSYKVISDAQYASILEEVANPSSNTDIIKLEKVPKVAVYTPSNKMPWDDAVTLVLTYAEIPFDKVYDDELLSEKLANYDWLHLHHEDFTGQYGKFWGAFRNATWYLSDVAMQEALAKKHGFKKVSQLKLAVAKKINGFVAGGGFLFAMCSAADSYDIALAADGTDICD